MPKSNSDKLQMDDLSTEELLNTAVDELAEPTLIPPGRWVMRCNAAKINLPREKDNFRYAYFLAHQPVEAIEADGALVEAGGWRGATVFSRFQIATPGDTRRANRMFEAHGISLDGRSPNALVTVAKGLYVEAVVGIRSYDRKTDEGTVTEHENTITSWKPTTYRERDAA